MWAYESVFYQIYPLGFCDAPHVNDGNEQARILKIIDWLPHIQKLGVNTIYMGPVFESDSHGYDTRDYCKLDCRLGQNSDFAMVCNTLHKHGIRIILDGVFNHVGRGFWAFQDVLLQREASPYKDWFYISFDGENDYQDHLWYQGWEGHYELVKLNLDHPDVRQYLFQAIEGWINEFDIDGLRLDVAYCLSQSFLDELHNFCLSKKADFFLLGELLHGDYNPFVCEARLHSCTNYECYKGLYSSFNSLNLYEITHSLIRQFGKDPWSLYTGKHLLNFVDNHDVTRIASLLTTSEHLPLIYGLLFGMPGIPCLYYGSEWGATGAKSNGSDEALRPSFSHPSWTPLTEQISIMASIHRNSPELIYGDYTSLVLTNRQIVFRREWQGRQLLIAINADNTSFTANCGELHGDALSLLTQEEIKLDGSLSMPPYSVQYLRLR